LTVWKENFDSLKKEYFEFGKGNFDSLKKEIFDSLEKGNFDSLGITDVKCKDTQIDGNYFTVNKKI
jgi:hypothetical protein